MCHPDNEAAAREVAAEYDDVEVMVDKNCQREFVYLMNPDAIVHEPISNDWMFKDFLP